MQRHAVYLSCALALAACDDQTAQISSPSKVPIPVVEPIPDPPADLPEPEEPEVVESGLDGPSTEQVEVRDVDGVSCLRWHAVELCGAWRWDADAVEYRGTGDMELILSAGVYRITQADLIVTLDPPRLTGLGAAAMPATGSTEDGETDTVPITVDGWADEETETSGVEVHGGMDLGIGELDFITEAFDLDVVTGVVDFAGDVGGLIVDTIFEDAQITLALFDPEEFIPRGPFQSDAGEYTPIMQAHLGVEGTARLNPFPVHLDGRVMLDADIDQDGEPDFTDPLGWALGGDGALRLDFQRLGWDFGLTLGDGAFFWDLGEGPAGLLAVRAHGALPDLFEGTPLAVMHTHADTRVNARFADVDDFLIRVDFTGALGPIDVHDAHLELSHTGIEGGMRISAIPGITDSFRVNGALSADARPAFMGSTAARIGGFVAQASVTLSEQGLAATTRLDVQHLGALDLAGELSATPRWSGRGELRPAGLRLAEVEATLSTDGLALAGHLDVNPLGSLNVSGHATPDTFELNGSGDLSLGGFAIADGAVGVSPAGAHARGRIQVLGVDVEVGGQLAGDGTRLTGQATLRPLGFELANAQISLGRDGADVRGRLHMPGLGSLDVSGRVHANGHFDLSGRGHLAPLGMHLANAHVRITHHSAQLSGRVGFGGAQFNVSGWMRSNGQFEMTGSVGGGGSAGPVSVRGTVRLRVRNQGADARFEGRGCLDLVFGERCQGVSGRVDSDGDICALGRCVNVL